MVLVAAISAALLRSLDRAARQAQTARPSAALASALVLFVVGVAASGLLTALGENWALYFYVGSAVIGLVAGVCGAWTFLTRAGTELPDGTRDG